LIDVLRAVAERMPALGITRCFVATFDRTSGPSRVARLALVHAPEGAPPEAVLSGDPLYLSEIARVAKASWAVTRLWLPEATTGWRSRRPMIQGDLRQKPNGQSNRERTECRIEASYSLLSYG
jgi:hypothetical protein